MSAEPTRMKVMQDVKFTPLTEAPVLAEPSGRETMQPSSIYPKQNPVSTFPSNAADITTEPLRQNEQVTKLTPVPVTPQLTYSRFTMITPTFDPSAEQNPIPTIFWTARTKMPTLPLVRDPTCNDIESQHKTRLNG